VTLLLQEHLTAQLTLTRDPGKPFLQVLEEGIFFFQELNELNSKKLIL
jgi:hypothetical protein